MDRREIDEAAERVSAPLRQRAIMPLDEPLPPDDRYAMPNPGVLHVTRSIRRDDGDALTVFELITLLQQAPQEAPVYLFLPDDQTGIVFAGVVFFDGNVHVACKVPDDGRTPLEIVEERLG